MKKLLLISFICLFLFSFVNAEKPEIPQEIVKLAKTLKFKGLWQVENIKPTNKLKPGYFLKGYNGFPFFPEKSGYHVGLSKTFARIVVSAECGYKLPAGSDYAKRDLKEVQPGDILQKSDPRPHTMIVVGVTKWFVSVLHCNYSGLHQVSYANFTMPWLTKEGYKVYRPGVDEAIVENEPALKTDPQSRGTYRVVVTGEVPYYSVCQGTIVSHSGPGPCKIVVNETRTVSNTFSVDCGVKAEVISASVGFSVTESFSRSLSFWKEVPDNKYGYVDLYYKYMVKKFDVYYKAWPWSSEEKVGSGKAMRWQAVEFQYRESNSKSSENVKERDSITRDTNPQTRGTFRVVVTGEVPYYSVCQGTIVSHSGPGPCKIVVNETRTVSNTFSANCGVNAEVITASVGFSVTASFSRSLSFWKEVPDGKYGYVDLYYKYMVKKFDVYYKAWPWSSEEKVGSGQAMRWQAVEFQYRESSYGARSGEEVFECTLKALGKTKEISKKIALLKLEALNKIAGKEFKIVSEEYKPLTEDLLWICLLKVSTE